MTIKANVDFRDAVAGLDKLSEVRAKLARSMAVAGGKVLRDEAKMRAPVGTDEGGSKNPGGLQRSIYVAYRDKASTTAKQVYAVSWNAKKAPHGHLIEFGHWQTHARYKGKDGNWYTGAQLAAPKWVPAKPFLRPALDSGMALAKEAMLARGRERLPELLAGGGADDL